MTRARPSRTRAAARARSLVRSSVRRKSPPVPRGMMPSSVVPPAPAARMPSAVSEIVPSPPNATTSRRPASASRRAMAVASRGAVVNTASNGPSPSVSPSTSRPQPASERPPPERGLTITSGLWGSKPPGCNRSPPRPEPPGVSCRAMILGVVLGLAASASWAVANVAVQRSARHVGAFRAILWAQVVGGLVVALALPFDTRAASPVPLDALWVLLAGAAGLLAYVCLFYAFEHGRLTMAVPVMSSWAVIAAGLSLVIFHEPVRPLQLVGGAIVVAGAVIVSRFA